MGRLEFKIVHLKYTSAVRLAYFLEYSTIEFIRVRGTPYKFKQDSVKIMSNICKY